MKKERQGQKESAMIISVNSVKTMAGKAHISAYSPKNVVRIFCAAQQVR